MKKILFLAVVAASLSISTLSLKADATPHPALSPSRGEGIQPMLAQVSAPAPAPTDAGDPANPAPSTPNPLDGVMGALAGKFGWIVRVFAIMGALRVVFKPTMSAIENVVGKEKVAGFEAGPIFKVISFILDFGASIKLPVISTATKTAP